ncbi:MAG: rod shape-determining protein [Lachnospiraceae bacterium]|nr:rod shape-determining protein [Lachnospiraceae bacterium]MBQ4068980.1 rod shape-determining protein [Lachnospiraceae bacterium]
MAQQIFGVDLGTSNFKLVNQSAGKVLNEKNIIAIKNKTEVFDYGDFAYEMYERAPANIEVSFPVQSGVIADIKNMDILFECFFRKFNNSANVGSSDFCVAVPTDITEVEKKAFYDLIAESKVKSKKITIVDKPIAAAVGVDIDVDSPRGNLIIDIGAETTEISVISLGGIVLTKIIKAGGSKLDETICNIVKKKYNLVIGSRTAETLKINLADAMDESDTIFTAYGRNIVTGLPACKDISSSLVFEAIQESLFSILDAVKIILERTPPELAADIMNKGVYLTGGSAQIKNLDRLITKETGLKVNIAENPSETVIHGISKIISDPELHGLMYVPTEKKYD